MVVMTNAISQLLTLFTFFPPVWFDNFGLSPALISYNFRFFLLISPMFWNVDLFESITPKFRSCPCLYWESVTHFVINWLFYTWRIYPFLCHLSFDGVQLAYPYPCLITASTACCICYSFTSGASYCNCVCIVQSNKFQTF